MLDLIIFYPSVAKIFSPSCLRLYGIHYSKLFKAMVAYRSGQGDFIESVMAPYIFKRVVFGDLLEFDLPAETNKFLASVALPAETP